MSGGGAEREGDTESETGSRLRAVNTEPGAGLELTDREIVTGAEVGCSTDRAPQAPRQCPSKYPQPVWGWGELAFIARNTPMI